MSKNPMRTRTLPFLASALLPLAAAAQMDHSHHMPGMDHGAMQHAAPPAPAPAPAAASAPIPAPAMAPAPMLAAPAMDHGGMQGGSAPPDARDPDAYSNGLHHGDMQGMDDMHDNAVRAGLLADKLEAKRDGGRTVLSFDAQAWVGTDLDKLWLKADGSRSLGTGGRLGATRTEALWDHAIAPFWSLQAGLRHDTGAGPARNWAAFGVQGLAPHWFEVQATAYVGAGGRTALRLEAEYDLLLTQRWVLQPHAKAQLHGRSDPARGIASGLSNAELGLRLRYEPHRQFAPYVGLVVERTPGAPVVQGLAAGHAVRQARVVMGFRMWF